MPAPVALESTVITHGLPRPANLDIARAMCAAVREGGGEPKLIAILRGRPRVGLTDPELEELALRTDARKCSLRDLPLLAVTGESGGTTVSSTLHLALRAGIQVFATGGIGGVHRGDDADISADLPALASLPGCVVCAGAKSILDLPRTRERLETDGVTLLGWRCDEMPAFYSRSSGLPVDQRVETAGEVARILRERDALGLRSAVLVTAPCPEDAALPAAEVADAIDAALADAKRLGIQGKALTPHLLAFVARCTQGRSMAANRALLLNNARIAADIANAFAELLS
jgi:pseudouridine-5'-phosphate glycosidase